MMKKAVITIGVFFLLFMVGLSTNAQTTERKLGTVDVDSMLYAKTIDSINYVMMLDSLNYIMMLDSINYIKLLDSINYVKEVDSINYLEKVDSLIYIEKLDSLDYVMEVDSINYIEKLDSINYIEKLDSLNYVEKLDSINYMEKLDSLIYVAVIDLINTITTVGTVSSVTLVDSIASMVSVNTAPDVIYKVCTERGTGADIRFEYNSANDALLVQDNAGATIFEIQDANKTLEFQDDGRLAFGDISDIYFEYDEAVNYLEIFNSSDTEIANLSTSGEFGVLGFLSTSEQLRLKEISSLGTATSGWGNVFMNTSGNLCYTNDGGTTVRTLNYSTPAPTPRPGPQPSSVDDWRIGVDEILYEIEYSSDYKKYRKVTKYFKKGILIEKANYEWKRMGLLKQLILK